MILAISQSSNTAIEQLNREKSVFAHLEILDDVAHFVTIGRACLFTVVPAVQGKSENRFAFADHVADFEYGARIRTDATKGRKIGDDGIAAVHQFAIGLVDKVLSLRFGLIL